MQNFCKTMFGDVRHKKSLLLLLSKTDPGKSKRRKFTDHEINIIKNLAIEILYGQRIGKEYVAVHMLEWYFTFVKKTSSPILKNGDPTLFKKNNQT